MEENMENAIRKVAVIGLSASLVLTSLSGCSKKKETFDTEAAAITVNGDTISAGVMNFAIRYNQASLESLYQSFGIDDPFNEDLFGSGSTLGEQAKSQVADTLAEALLAEQHMEDYGVTVTDTEKEQISSAAAQFMSDNDASVLEELNITQDSVERYLELMVIQDKMEEQMCADVDTEVSDEEAAQRRIQYVVFAPVTEEETEEETEVLTEEETAAEETAAEEETETLTEAGETQTEEETAALTEEDSTKTQSADETETEAVEAETTSETELTAETELEEAETETEAETEDPETIAARERAYEQAAEMIAQVQAGTDFAEAAEALGKTASENTFGADYSLTELVEATDGLEDGTLVEEPILVSTGSYYVVQVVSQLDREATDEEKESIVEDRKDECIQSLYEEWSDAGEITTDEDVIATITFDYHLAQPEEAETEAAEIETEALTEVLEAETEAETEAKTEETTETEIVTEAETEA
jgi:foldase protein PrsA